MSCLNQKKGEACACTGYVKRLRGDKCGVCRHAKSEHVIAESSEVDGSASLTHTRANTDAPVPFASTVRGILERFTETATQGPAKTSSLPVVPLGSSLGIEAARAETSAGFRPKRAGELVKPTGGSRGKESVKTIRPTKIGRVTFLTCGLNSDGTLADTRNPPLTTVQRLQTYGVSVDSLKGSPLEFLTTYDTAQIDAWLRRLFRQLFLWADRFGELEDGQVRWKAVAKQGRKLVVYEKVEGITGDDLFRMRGPSSRSYREHELRFVLVNPIPARVYKNWDAAMLAPIPSAGIEDTQESEDDDQEPKDASDSDSDPGIFARTRSVHSVNKGKARQVSPTPDPEDELEDDVDDGNSVISIADTDDGELSSAFTFFDDPPRKAPVVTATTSCKRARSATVSDENALVKRKRSKSGRVSDALTASTSTLSGPSTRPVLTPSTAPNIGRPATITPSSIVALKDLFGAIPKVGADAWN
ncbi:hypothetical protein NMY22_g17725 [Coprinellus aureogranulatus]|nr:hypothetical protein NMY22_g17725 [Coprinellus aureogranulatus]